MSDQQNDLKVQNAKNTFALRLENIEMNTTHPGQRAILIGYAVDTLCESIVSAAAAQNERTRETRIMEAGREILVKEIDTILKRYDSASGFEFYECLNELLELFEREERRGATGRSGNARTGSTPVGSTFSGSCRP